MLRETRIATKYGDNVWQREEVMFGFTSQKAVTLFGYFCIVEADGTERIMVQVNTGDLAWQFPIVSQFDISELTPEQAVSSCISRFVDEQHFIDRDDLQSSGLHPFQIHLVRLSPDLIPAYFFKARVQKEIGHKSTKLKWGKKTAFFIDHKEYCLSPRLLEAIHEELVYPQAGLKVLDCVDMLVFRKV